MSFEKTGTEDANPRSVNYIYFGLLFVLLSFLHVFHVLLIEEGSFLYRSFYVLYALCQCLIEVGVLIYLSKYLVSKFPRSLNPLFIFLTLILFIMHMIDFPLVRFMDISIWYVMGFLTEESFENFIEMLYATNISLIKWALGGVCGLIILVFGIIFFRLTEAVARKKPLKLSHKYVGLNLVLLIALLSLFELKAEKIGASPHNLRFLKALPWKTTIFPSSSYPVLEFQKPLRKVPKEKKILSALRDIPKAKENKPNIFLFVVESLREDYLGREIAPSFHNFKQEGISFEHGISASTCTQYSWFSIFQARHPLYWKQMQPSQWPSGSLPLQLLKKMGYKIHLYSSSRFNFYHMDNLLFGKKRELLDTAHFFAEEGEKREAYVNDAACFDQLKADMQRWDKEEGHLFLIFLESTHFGYSFSPDKKQLFSPQVDPINYVEILYSKDNLEGIKNRYKNAISYVDGLFGDFLNKLDSLEMAKEGVVVLTADHGEEFFEEGHIFHASTLNSMQTEVPIYYRFGKRQEQPRPFSTKLSSHVDIFPTLLNYVTGTDQLSSFFDGTSIFSDHKERVALSARYNANRAPYEFMLHKGDHKVLLRFLDEKNIHRSSALQVIAKKTARDQSVPFTLKELEDEYGYALRSLFE